MARKRNACAVPLTVTNTSGHDCTRAPVTSGVPLKQGTVMKGDALQLLDSRGNPIPLQHKPLALWPDKSVKWALLDFATSIAAGEAARYTLQTGESPAPEKSVKVSRKGDVVRVATGPLRLVFRADTGALIDEAQTLDDCGEWQTAALSVDALVKSADGTFTSAPEGLAIEVEERGPARATVALRGQHLDRRGNHCFSFVFRLSAYAGSRSVKLEYMILNDNQCGVFTKLRECILRAKLPEAPAEVEIGGFSAGKPGASVRLFQEDDTRCALTGIGRKQKGEKAPGWIRVGALSAAVRDFWQQWPKSIELTGDALTLGLFPALEAGQYNGKTPIDKHYYLFKNRDYLIKTGVAKRHEMWLSFEGDVSGEQLSARANAPLMAVADPTWIAETGAMGDMLPAGGPASADYDRVASFNARVYRQTTEEERQYGVLNWGDWFGERTYNWGNNEYDTAHAFYLLFARTGDVAHFYEAERSAKHMADVDTLHAFNDDYLTSGEIGGDQIPIGIGAMYLHAFGHVGGYLPLKKAARMFPKCYTAADPRNLGHMWTEGMFETHYFTGDPWVKEAALELADWLAGHAEIEGFTWWFGKDPHCGRTAGWPLHALMAAYHATGRQKYLWASKHIIEHAVADQDPHCGGWVYELYPGHCFCEIGHRHMGMAVFITGVLLAGMIEYHRVTGDDRVADSIVRAVDFMIADAWDDIEARFHYTSCPASALTTPMRVIWPIAYAIRLANKPLHKRVLKKAFATYVADNDAAGSGRGYGKSFASAHRSVAQALPTLAKIAEEDG